MFFKQKKKKLKNTVQEFIGIETFTKRGLKTKYGELVYFMISPTNISVLSNENIQTKIWHLMQVLSAQPNIEITLLCRQRIIRSIICAVILISSIRI